MAKDKKAIFDEIQVLKKDLLADLDRLISGLNIYNTKNTKEKEQEQVKNILDKIDNNL